MYFRGVVYLDVYRIVGGYRYVFTNLQSSSSSEIMHMIVEKKRKESMMIFKAGRRHRVYV